MKVRVETYGCTMNQGEGAELAEKLAALGHEVVDDPRDADLVVLNTCTVIKETENRMLKRMAELNGQRKKIIVAGCMASVQADEIIKHAPSAIIMAPRDYPSFSSVVESAFGRGEASPLVVQSCPVTSVLPVAQGCIGACSYCITRFARGTLASYPADSLIAAARSALQAGARELLVTAQDTACYGFDRGTDLSALLDGITALPGEFMVRVGMMNPDNLGRIIDRFLPSWTSPKVYQFTHLPVQSGSAAVLEGMNRGYRPEEFTSLVARLRAASPSMTLSTDIITGFPGETEEDHRATVDLLNEVRPDTVNVTRFSPRQGTPAARARNQVPGWVSKERSRELSRLRFEISSAVNAALVGRREKVLVTEEGKSGTSIARTASYKPVVLPGKLPLGTWLDAEVVSSAPTHLFGRTL
ncbi:MAG: tRNA (N(6)-L-threonylcarbamoyladenosine(37)-C(2))-methylthiotransferase [Methanomassiliicoccus sp.]|nr:tRNA (N(6)-L-threonylcarbamoyladenosine(37)-C(2))-methylthiotransferase [Methanomassiliicoccus sp.]